MSERDRDKSISRKDAQIKKGDQEKDTNEEIERMREGDRGTQRGYR